MDFMKYLEDAESLLLETAAVLLPRDHKAFGVPHGNRTCVLHVSKRQHVRPERPIHRGQCSPFRA